MELLQELDALHLMLTNARRHPVIQPRLAAYGYNETKIQQGIDLLLLIRNQRHTQCDAYEAGKQVGSGLKVEMKNIRQQFTDHRTLAAIALREDEAAFRQLRLHQAQERKLVPWLEQATQFYHVAPQYQKQLTRFGLTKAQLDQGKAMLAGIQQKRQQQLQCKGDAQHATHSRDKTLKSLRQWTRSFRAVARVALENEPQLLESLGIVVTSR